ncbi:MAG TPA: type II toxin-antitoxin system HigB family toxin [Tepidisphaeraceae bacterium]
MTILNLADLHKALRKHPQTRAWLLNWMDVTAKADWHSIQDVRSNFPSADGVRIKSGTIVTIFNVKGNEFRLLTSVHYANQQVFFLDLLTHAEYDKQKWR